MQKTIQQIAIDKTGYKPDEDNTAYTSGLYYGYLMGVNDQSTGIGEAETFAISFAVWALHDPQAQAYQSAGITAYELLEKYKSRAYIDNSNPTNQ